MKPVWMPIVLAALLAGCVQADQVPVNVDRAQLMPDPVARQVLAKYIKADWVANPYFVCPDAWVGAQRARGPISSIVAIRYAPAEQKLYISNVPWGGFCQNNVTGWIEVGGLSQAAATELTTALVSLGASNE
jgi:hypothetical protein